jgi:hypothetical protein
MNFWKIYILLKYRWAAVKNASVGKKALGRNYFSGDPLNPSAELMCRFVIL